MKLNYGAILSSLTYLKVFLKWVVISLFLGAICGFIGFYFHEFIEIATHFRIKNSYIIYFLPIAGLLIALIYNIFKNKGQISTNRVIKAVQTNETVPFVMSPMIFISTVITHLFGGSAGREGAALQLGGSLGYNMGKILRLKEKDLHIIVMSGMSAVFAALFGTPLTAAFFAVEVCFVGAFHYAALVPSIMSSLVAYRIAATLGANPEFFHIFNEIAISPDFVIKILLLSVLCALVSILFCTTMKSTEHLAEKYLKNPYVRVAVGGIIIALLTLVLNTQDYNGAGMNVIARAMNGKAEPYDFILKLLFTAITLSAGFKGGEIVPAFFVGATFGCVAASLFGLDAGFGASVGFIAVFCGVTNCPIASVMLSVEFFGAQNVLIYAVVCCVSFMMSGRYGLYKDQKLLYSKLYDEENETNAR